MMIQYDRIERGRVGTKGMPMCHYNCPSGKYSALFVIAIVTEFSRPLVCATRAWQAENHMAVAFIKRMAFLPREFT